MAILGSTSINGDLIILGQTIAPSIESGSTSSNSVMLDSDGKLRLKTDNNHVHNYQPLDADLTSIAGISGTTGLLRKTAADTWSLDTTGYTTNTGTVTSITLNATSPILIDYDTAITTSGTRVLSHATSGVTAASYGTASTANPGYGGSFTIPYVTVNNTGHITSASNVTVNLPASDNTNYYPTTWEWTDGGASGPTASLSGVGMSAVSISAIPIASAKISGIVTTGAQTFAGVKTFNSTPNVGGNNVILANDGRLTDARTPLSHTHGNILNTGYIGTTASLPIITGVGGIVQAGSFGTISGTFCQGNDSRLSDARVASDVYAWAKASTKPTYTYSEIGAAASSHTHGNITNAGAIGTTSDLIVKTTASGVLNTLAAGSSGQFLQYNGTWATPPQGTITSIGMTVPTGLTVAPASITTSGTFALTFTSGYSIPTTVSQTNWNTAYGWGNHNGLYLSVYGDTIKGDLLVNEDNVYIIGDYNGNQFKSISAYDIYAQNDFHGNLDGTAYYATRLSNTRTLTIGGTGKTFDGTSNVTWTKEEIGIPQTKITDSTTYGQLDYIFVDNNVTEYTHTNGISGINLGGTSYIYTNNMYESTIIFTPKAFTTFSFNYPSNIKRIGVLPTWIANKTYIVVVWNGLMFIGEKE